MQRFYDREARQEGKLIADRLKNEQKQQNEQKKNINLYKEYRKTLTGVLIDLHWLRILGAQSKVLAANTEMLGKAFGYLIDMILLPMFPVMVKFTKMVLGLARWIRHLDGPTRLLIAGLGSLAIGVTVLMTVIYTAVSAINAFSAALIRATGATVGQTATGAITTVGGGMVGGGLASKFTPGMFFAPEMFPAMNKLSGPGAYSHNPTDRMKMFAKILGIPGFAEGGVATKATAGIFGEKGAEAIIPLSKIGEVMGGILGSGMGFVNTLTQAAMGSGGVGGGLNMPGTGGGGGTLVKGFSWVAMSINEGFKITNELLAAILALMAQGGGGAGGENPVIKSLWDFIETPVRAVWEWITTTVRSVWEWIATPTRSVWEFLIITTKVVWEFLITPAKVVWEFLATPVRSIWEFISTTGAPTTSGTPTGSGSVTPTGTGTPAPASSGVLYSYGLYDSVGNAAGSALVYANGTVKEQWWNGKTTTRKATSDEMNSNLWSGYGQTNVPGAGSDNNQQKKTPGGGGSGGITISAGTPYTEATPKSPYVSPAGSTPYDVSKMESGNYSGSAYPWGLSDIVNIVGVGVGISKLGQYGVSTLINELLPGGIPGFANGGVMPNTGLAYLHEGETVIPKAGGGSAGGITINNPTFVVSGRTERELFENFMRLMKTEGSRVH